MEQKSQYIGVRLTPPQMDLLNDILKFKILQAPLLPPTQSDVVREAIVRYGGEIEKYRCPQCGQFTIPDEHRPGARWCGNCAEPVLWLGENGK